MVKWQKILSAETIDYCIKNRGGNNQEIFFVQILRKCYHLIIFEVILLVFWKYPVGFRFSECAGADSQGGGDGRSLLWECGTLPGTETSLKIIT